MPENPFFGLTKLPIINPTDVEAVAETTVLVAPVYDGDVVLPDDVIGQCERCPNQICFRPHSIIFKHKICMKCAVEEISKEPTEQLDVRVTEQTADEVTKYLRKENT